MRGNWQNDIHPVLMKGLAALHFSHSAASLSAITNVFPQEIHSAAAAPQTRKLLTSACYCESWKFSVETSDAGSWSAIPKPCVKYVINYLTGGRYLSDLEMVAADSLTFAKTVDIAADGMDACVFDIDETFLSNLAHFLSHING
ncbi:hypothetical protein Ancab_028505 [Ancistrocladus abbreviatus]